MTGFTRRQFGALLATIAVTIALVSLPVTIFYSGNVRNAQNHAICLATLRQWRISSKTIIRFTAPNTIERHDAYKILGRKPTC